MLEVVIIFLASSLILYVLTGGPDFGAGIISIVSKHNDEEAKALDKAIAPIWEANHMWLIIIIVILFMGFPKVYTLISTFLHIPILILLLGLVLRGTAFTFRHYDETADRYKKLYTRIFNASSLITPFFLGVVFGSMFSGKINILTLSFSELYIFPWLNVFSLSTGLFTCILCAYLASAYILSENLSPSLIKSSVKRLKTLNIAVVVSGILVFASSYLIDFNLIELFSASNVSITGLILVTLCIPFVWFSVKEEHYNLVRAGAAMQAALVVFSFVWISFPVIVRLNNGLSLTFFNAAAPKSVIQVLAIALLTGSLLIFPFLFYLYKIFKFRDVQCN